MDENIYVEKLAWFKRNEKPEAVLLIAGDTERTKLVIAWTNSNVQINENLTKLDTESENEIWKWLWDNTTYSLKELKEKIGTASSEIALENKMKPLVGNHIIYPDGTVNSYVQRYLRERVVGLFESKIKESQKTRSA